MDDFFNDLNNSPPTGEEEFFSELVTRALTSKQSNFEFIRSWRERLAVKVQRFQTEAVVKVFKNLYDATYKTYIDQVTIGNQDLQTILALKQFKQCLKYYEREWEIAQEMLDEHWSYIWCGHLLDTLVGNYRPDQDLVDHRRRGKNGK
jgi:predicted alpha-1,6-mannanase (GH76 family)